jgi:hypothetical protein
MTILTIQKNLIGDGNLPKTFHFQKIYFYFIFAKIVPMKKNRLA